MRLTAYKEALDQALDLPICMTKFDYFKTEYNPQRRYVVAVLTSARKDERITLWELVKLYEYSEIKRRGEERREEGRGGR